jgi:hypothetical protein
VYKDALYWSPVGVIQAIRRGAARVALVLVLGQGASVAVAAVIHAGDALGIAKADCCVKGAHPPGMCPLHRKATPSATCRLSCAASTNGPVVLISATSLIAPMVVAEPSSVRTVFFNRAPSLLESAPVSPTPPPRS